MWIQLLRLNNTVGIPEHQDQSAQCCFGSLPPKTLDADELTAQPASRQTIANYTTTDIYIQGWILCTNFLWQYQPLMNISGWYCHTFNWIWPSFTFTHHSFSTTVKKHKVKLTIWFLSLKLTFLSAKQDQVLQANYRSTFSITTAIFPCKGLPD